MYLWFVLLHLVGLVIFLAMHGVSMAVSFWVRGQTDRATIVSLLMLSSRAVQVAYLGLVLLGIGGLGAAANVGWLTASWVVASYIVLAVVVVAMYAIAAPYYYGLREAIEGREGRPADRRRRAPCAPRQSPSGGDRRRRRDRPARARLAHGAEARDVRERAGGAAGSPRRPFSSPARQAVIGHDLRTCVPKFPVTCPPGGHRTTI